jgi:hypothetical protein
MNTLNDLRKALMSSSLDCSVMTDLLEVLDLMARFQAAARVPDALFDVKRFCRAAGKQRPEEFAAEVSAYIQNVFSRQRSAKFKEAQCLLRSCFQTAATSYWDLAHDAKVNHFFELLVDAIREELDAELS